MPGLTYPYARHDRLLASHDDLDLEFSPAPNPPAGTAGGAARYKYWVDTTTSTLRQCIAGRATAGVYVPGEWITLGVVDLSTGKFHFNTDGVDFTGGSGALAVHDLTVSGTSNLNILSVGGATSLNTLSVGGATTLHATSVTGGLTVSGAITGATLSISGDTNLNTLEVAGATSLHSTTVNGDLTTTGTTTTHALVVTTISGPGGGLLTLADLTVSGLTTLNDLAVGGNTTLNAVSVFGNLQVAGNTTLSSDATVAGNLAVNGTATVGALHSASDVTGSSINSSGPVTGTAITGTAVSSSGLMTAGADLQVDGNLHVAHDTDIGGNLNVANNLTVGGAFTVSGAFAPGGDVVAHSKFISNFDGTDYQVLSVVTDSVNILTWLTGPGWTGPTGCQIRLYQPGLGILYQASGHAFHAEGTVGTSIDTLGPSIAIFLATGETANSTGSWGIISDDNVKENITPYTAGLADILELDPVSFTYMVPATTRSDAPGWSPFADAPETKEPTVRYGLLASNVRQVLPEMAALLEFGQDPSVMLWTISPTHLVYVLTNAVKELAAQNAPVTDGSEAAAGQIGEYIVVSNTTGIASASDVPTQVCMLSLTAGDWEVWGCADFKPPSNVSPNMVASSVSIHPDALPSEADLMTGIGILNMFTTTALTSGQRQVLMTGQCRSNTAAPIDLYLVSQVQFSGSSTVLTKGYICARRVR